MAPFTFSFQNNAQATLALRYIEKTNATIFITGKAGTGKTTFLKHIKETASKRCVVVAPTGIAALNAEGVTIHSFFGLPLSPFIPSEGKPNFKSHLSSKKMEVIRHIEMLIIDEISMVRADVLDAIDVSLRFYRKDSTPFGGVQLVMMGDLQQLPPVVTDEDRQILSPYYSNFYFFESVALKKIGFVTIEFEHIYRQKDPRFIELLNAVRDNQLNDDVTALLKSRYIPDFQSSDYIMLFTHNQQALQLNNDFLSAIKQPIHCYDAIIQGNFPESMFPTEQHLHLKKGARIMFLKNDPSGEKLYYNGKIGIVQAIDNESITILCDGETKPVSIQPMEWQNIHYVYNDEKKQIEEEILGSFTQFPLKLAWAITIHKSQGLSFDKVIIDAKNAFAHGQIYVALSRCRSLDGVILSTMFNQQTLVADPAVMHFMKQQKSRINDEQLLIKAENDYFRKEVFDLFDFSLFKVKWTTFISAILTDFEPITDDDIRKIKSITELFDQQVNVVNNQLLDQLQVDVENEGNDLSILQNHIKQSIPHYLVTLRKLSLSISTLKKIHKNKKATSNLITIQKELLEYLAQKMFYLEQSQDGFSPQKYKQAIRIVETQTKQTSNNDQANQKKQASARPNQQLYFSIMAWRNAKAVELDQEPYDILRQIAVEKIVSQLPATIKELSSIKELGNKRIQQYGDEILDIVTEYLYEQGLKTPQYNEVNR